MSLRGDVDKSRDPRLGQLMTILIIAAIIIAVGILVLIFIIIPEKNEMEQTNTDYLPPDCYKLNGKIICPKR
jgi:flagellar basal body-associated protein FliL